MSKENKIAVIVPFFKREELTALCFKHLLRQSKKYNFDVFVSGDNKKIVPKDFIFIEAPNIPVGNKNNILLQETLEYDGVMIVGSDDFLSDSIFELYKTIDLTQKVYYGFNNLHIYSCHNNKITSDFPYTKNGNTVGVARLWSKPTLEAMNYKLWTSFKNRGLDSDSKTRMLSKGIKEITIDYGEHFILDVKQGYNITNPAIVNTGYVDCDISIIKEKLGVISNDILSLKPLDVKQIYSKRIMRDRGNKIKVIYSKDSNGILKGTIKMLDRKIADQVIKIGIVKEVHE